MTYQALSVLDLPSRHRTNHGILLSPVNIEFGNWEKLLNSRLFTNQLFQKVGEFLGEKGQMIGLKEASVVICGVGAGRESVLRAFSGKGVQIKSIKDVTPVPHNGPRPPKPRRV